MRADLRLGVDHELFRPVTGSVADFPYVLYVGSEHPRKNLGALLEAFSIVKANPEYGALKLLKVGSPGGCEGPYREQTEAIVQRLNLERHVVFVGRVPDEDLPALYSHAACLAMPSLYEGFGLPPIEAMSCGCPVIVSDFGALAEVAGDAAVTIDPRDPPELANAIRRLLEDRELRQEMVRRGLERASRFTWKRTALETLKVYAKVEMLLGLPDPGN